MSIWRCEFNTWRDEDQEEPEVVVVEFEVELPDGVRFSEANCIPWPAL